MVNLNVKVRSIFLVKAVAEKELTSSAKMGLASLFWAITGRHQSNLVNKILKSFLRKNSKVFSPIPIWPRRLQPSPSPLEVVPSVAVELNNFTTVTYRRSELYSISQERAYGHCNKTFYGRKLRLFLIS
jgi:hypothetical protein